MEELVSMELTILSIMTVNLMKRTVNILMQREQNSMSKDGRRKENKYE